MVAKILPPVPVDAAPRPQTATKAAGGTTAPAATSEHAAASAPAGPADTAVPARAEAAFAATASARAEAVAAAEAALTQRVAFLRDNASVLQSFGAKLLSQLMHVRHSPWSPPTPGPTVRCRRRLPGNLGPDCCSHLLPMCVSHQQLLWPQVYASTMQGTVRTQALTAISRIVYFNEPEALK